MTDGQHPVGDAGSEGTTGAHPEPAGGAVAPLGSASASPFDGVVYQIYPRSFRDTSGDGVGDLAGITAGLDHLAWLGVDAVWLSPIYRSPMRDFGYDISDHCDVDPIFGSLADVDALIDAAHTRGLEVWLDFVPNHTSDQHPWFQDAIGSRQAPKRDWYVWRDPAPDGGPPNNWTRDFADGAPAWTFEQATGQYYLHEFLPEQPSVDWSNPDLRAAMLDVLRFWMARGVDGFRSDVIHLIGKSPELPDDPPELVGVPRAGHHHDPQAVVPHLRAIRACLDAVPGTTMVGEVNLPDAAQVATYVGADRLHLAFQFGLLYAPWEARSWRETIRYVQSCFEAVGVPATWVLSNHDWSRIASRAGGEDGARVAATLLFTLRGVPFLYMGDELGLADAVVPPERVVDPGGRDGCRAPLPWRADPSSRHGWTGEPWLPWPPDPSRHSVEAQRSDPRSVLHLHRRLIALRRDHPSLRSGAMHHVEVHDDVVAFDRGGAPRSPAVRVLANLGADDVEVESAEGWRVVLTSDLDPAAEGHPFRGLLPARCAVLLEAAAD